MDISVFRSQLYHTLNNNILSYWLSKMRDPRGDWYGRRDGEDRLYPRSPKGGVLNARILWSFAAAYGRTHDPRYLEAAQMTRDYIIDRFYDPEYGGIYWMLDYKGRPLDTKKQFYAIGFAIYGLSELARVSDDPIALEYAKHLYEDIEAHSFDPEYGGYIEALTRDWQPIADMRLSEKEDAAACKTMNTHLHIIEPYTNLYRVWPDEGLKNKILDLLRIFFDRILDKKTWHLGLFFDREWHRLDNEISYGHDIEASWLLLESAQVVGDESLIEETMRITRKIADAAAKGTDYLGSMIYERHGDGTFNEYRDWWVQAENVIGQLYQWKFHNRPSALEKAWKSWLYISDNIIDWPEGEWHWGRFPHGEVNRRDDKAGPWKCPYHNSRMCLEALRLL